MVWWMIVGTASLFTLDAGSEAFAAAREVAAVGRNQDPQETPPTETVPPVESGPPIEAGPPVEAGPPATGAPPGGEAAVDPPLETPPSAADTGTNTVEPGQSNPPNESVNGSVTDTELGAVESAAAADMTAHFQQVVLGKVDPTLNDLRLLQDRVRGLVEKLRPAVVGIRMGGGQGSGVIVTGDGYILTAAHVVGRKGQKAQIVMPDGSTHSATVLGTDASSDSGMLQMDKSGPWPYVEIGESDRLERGQWLMALGHPGGFDPDRHSVVRVGRLLMEPGRTTLQTDCTLVGGDSGGPLFDLEGRVVGIHSRISRRIQQNYHVSVDIYTSQWDDMSRAPRPNLGLSLESAEVTKHLIIEEIHRDGPADKAGLKKGDKLLKVNGQAVSNRDELRNAVDSLSLFESIKVVVARDEAEVEVDLVVGVK